VGIEHIIIVNLGLSSISVFGLLMAIFIGITLVWKEIDKRTIFSILAKPVRRWEFILGKYAGLMLTLLINTAVMTAGFYLALLYAKRTLEREDRLFCRRSISSAATGPVVGIASFSMHINTGGLVVLRSASL
jgi:ABC-type transport system involved in multi-copper enzyme maturation permease subunit